MKPHYPNLRTNSYRFTALRLLLVAALLSVFILSGAPEARSQVLVTLTNQWRYNQSGTDPGVGWRQTVYDDSLWPIGRSVLRTNTPLSLTNASGQRVITYYFRTHFAYAGSPGPVWLGLTNLIDDGAVVYLNGAEVYRFNMPPGDPSYGTFATSTVDNAVFIGANFLATNLAQGDNVLAAEVHQWGTNSTDIVFGFQLARVTPPLITLQPQSVVVPRTYNATFSIETAANLTPLAYQWRKDGADIPGANGAAYTVTNVKDSDAGLYSVMISNALGQAISFYAQMSVTAPYTFLTMAGLPATNGTTDGLGSAARFHTPSGVALDFDEDIYVTDLNNHTIRKITRDGLVTTLAGRAGILGHQDGTGSGALFNQPMRSAVDREGNIFVVEHGNHVIRRVTPDGAVTTIAGAPQQLGNINGTNDAARFNQPHDVVLDSNENLFVAGYADHTIRKVARAGTNWVVTTIAGSGVAGNIDGMNLAARFRFPSGLGMDQEGNLYVTDYTARTIRKLRREGTNWVVSTIAGADRQAGTADGLGTAARFGGPESIAVDGAGNVFVVDLPNHAIRKITPGGWVTTIAGLAGTPGAVNGTGAAARFNYPRGITVDASGNLYVADGDNHTIRKGWIEGATPSTSLSPPVLSSNKVEILLQIRTGTLSNSRLLHAPDPAGPWATNTSARFTSIISGLSYLITAPIEGSVRYYRFCTQ